MIWVCAPEGELEVPAFYTHVCKAGRFHHSSLVAGDDVIGAGEWIVRDGKLCKVSANSGHYRPTMSCFYRAVLHMATAFQDDTTVFLYDTVTDQWVDYRIRDFIAQPSCNGRYKVHPDSTF